MQHSIYGASSASRWGSCAGSTALSRGIPRRGNSAAHEGTAGHTLGEQCLRTDAEPYDFIETIIKVEEEGKVVAEIEVSVDLAEAVSMYVEYVRGLPGLLWLESRINYAELIGVAVEDGFGTGDACRLDGTTLHVIDAKFGRGYVDPYKNKQMILYGAGVVAAIEFLGDVIEEIQLHVVQPRVSDKPVPYIMTRAELATEVAELRKGAMLSEEASATFTDLDNLQWIKIYLNPGETQCQWCPASAICPALRNVASDFTAACDEEFGIVNLLEQLPGKELGKYQSMVSLVDIWTKAVEHETVRRLTRGDDIAGWKLVKGREGNRKWADEVAAAKELSTFPVEVTHQPAKLKTLPQVETALKALKKEGKGTPQGDAAKAKLETIAELSIRSPAKPTLTTSDDPREKWQEAADASEFAEVAP